MTPTQPNHRKPDAGYVAAVVLLLGMLMTVRAGLPGVSAIAAATPALWLVGRPDGLARLGGLLLMEFSVGVSAALATPPAGVALWFFPIVAVVPRTISTPWMRSVAAGGAVAAFLGSEILSAEPMEGGEVHTILTHLLSVGGALYTTYQVVDAQRPANR